MSRPTADIVADLRTPPVNLNWWNIMLEAADRLAELEAEVEQYDDRNAELAEENLLLTESLAAIDAARSICPTCGGTHVLWPLSGTGHASAGLPCPDCVDGKMPFERMAAIVNAVFDDTRVGGWPLSDYNDYLRSVKPT